MDVHRPFPDSTARLAYRVYIRYEADPGLFLLPSVWLSGSVTCGFGREGLALLALPGLVVFDSLGAGWSP
jgi:hypothetical protein